MKILIPITEKHLNHALSLPWSTCSCLVAQAIRDATKSKVTACSGSSASLANNRVVQCPDAQEYQILFDKSYGPVMGLGQIKDPETLARLRAMLPVEVEAEILEPKTTKE